MQTHFLSWGKAEVRLNYEQVDIWGTFGGKKLDLSTHLMKKHEIELPAQNIESFIQKIQNMVLKL